MGLWGRRECTEAARYVQAPHKSSASIRAAAQNSRLPNASSRVQAALAQLHESRRTIPSSSDKQSGRHNARYFDDRLALKTADRRRNPWLKTNHLTLHLQGVVLGADEGDAEDGDTAVAAASTSAIDTVQRARQSSNPIHRDNDMRRQILQ